MDRGNRRVIEILIIIAMLVILVIGIRGCVKKDELKSENLSYEDKLNYIENHDELYPPHFQKFAQNYPEAVDFVYAYPEKQDYCPKNFKEEKEKRNGFPLYIQWDERWGYCSYNENTIGTGGCGPTAFAILYAGMTGDYSHNPKTIARFIEKESYCTPGNGTHVEMMTAGAEKLGLVSHPISVVESIFKDYLDKGMPLVINVGPGIFTTGGHFMVIDDYNEDGFMILDPNSYEKTDEVWPFEEFHDQIKFAWAFEWAEN